MLETIVHKADLCVVGGGISGMFASVTAARAGLRVCLMQDRPLVGGNASGEIRMWIRGAAYGHPEYRESGLMEELTLANCLYNPDLSYVNWDALLLGLVKAEPNIDLILNCSCFSLEKAGAAITKVRGWQLTTYTFHEVEAPYFCDSSGDSVLAPLAGAAFTKGREGKDVYGERFAPNETDGKTMGMSCMLQATEREFPVPYTPPPFAAKLTKEDFRQRLDLDGENGWNDGNFWWLELGGEGDSVGDTERVRDRLVPIAYGVWDFIKNSGAYKADNWELTFAGFLPGKRESNRYVGDYVLTQRDIDENKRFEDEAAYGGWPVDDHDPRGFDFDGPPNWFHDRPQPYRIPYRVMYSVNIDNLFVAGRNISCSHLACSSARVMATCGLVGQAVGSAAAIAVREKISPRGVLGFVAELKQRLRDADCYLLGTPRVLSAAARAAAFNVTERERAGLLDGIERDIGGAESGVWREIGQPLDMRFAKSIEPNAVRIVFDSDLPRVCLEGDYCFNTRQYPMRNHRRLNEKNMIVPPVLVRDADIFVLRGEAWEKIAELRGNIRRLVTLSCAGPVGGVRVLPLASYGAARVRIMSLDVLD